MKYIVELVTVHRVLVSANSEEKARTRAVAVYEAGREKGNTIALRALKAKSS